MRFLLDTNILLWVLLRPARLNAATLAMIEDE
jgi:PIN domain nuclease of toxin-antitoxin system